MVVHELELKELAERVELAAASGHIVSSSGRVDHRLGALRPFGPPSNAADETRFSPSWRSQQRNALVLTNVARGFEGRECVAFFWSPFRCANPRVELRQDAPIRLLFLGSCRWCLSCFLCESPA